MSSAVHTSIDIAAPPEKVWDVVMDPERLGDWVTIHRRLNEPSDVPLQKGSTLDQTLCIRGVSFKVHWKVTDVHLNSLAVWEGRGPARSKASTAYRLSPDGNGGTRFDYENDFKAPLGPLGAAASRALVGGVPEREANASLAKLKKLLED